MSFPERNHKISFTIIYKFHYFTLIMNYTYFSFICGNDVTVKTAHPSHIADLIKAFVTFDVAPFLIHRFSLFWHNRKGRAVLTSDIGW